jgi:hypothetical protein
MLTIKDFITDHENLTNLLSTATYGNVWPVVKAYKSDADKGLFTDCECMEDKWAEGLLHGKGVVVYDCYDENIDEDANDFTEFPESAKHHITIKDVEKGLKLMRDQYPRHYADLMEEDDDAITGDVWLQLAVFGELIYG